MTNFGLNFCNYLKKIQKLFKPFKHRVWTKSKFSNFRIKRSLCCVNVAKVNFAWKCHLGDLWYFRGCLACTTYRLERNNEHSCYMAALEHVSHFQLEYFSIMKLNTGCRIFTNLLNFTEHVKKINCRHG